MSVGSDQVDNRTVSESNLSLTMKQMIGLQSFIILKDTARSSKQHEKDACLILPRHNQNHTCRCLAAADLWLQTQSVPAEAAGWSKCTLRCDYTHWDSLVILWYQNRHRGQHHSRPQLSKNLLQTPIKTCKIFWAINRHMSEITDRTDVDIL